MNTDNVDYKLNTIKAIKKGWDITMKSPLKFFFWTIIWLITFFMTGFASLPSILWALFNNAVSIYIILLIIANVIFINYLCYIITQKTINIYNEYFKLNNINKDPLYRYEFDWLKFVRFIVLSSISVTLVYGIILLSLLGGMYLILNLLIYYILIKISMSIFFTLDKNLSILESIKMSWSATHNNFFQILFLIVLVLFVNLLGVSCLFIGVGITMPIIMFATIDAYKQMIGEAK